MIIQGRSQRWFLPFYFVPLVSTATGRPGYIFLIKLRMLNPAALKRRLRISHIKFLVDEKVIKVICKPLLKHFS